MRGSWNPYASPQQASFPTVGSQRSGLQSAPSGDLHQPWMSGQGVFLPGGGRQPMALQGDTPGSAWPEAERSPTLVPR